MLGDSSMTTSVAVKDVEAAKKFYSEVLGLTLVDESPVGVTYTSGDSKLLVYPSQFAGTNKATYAAWSVDNIEAAVADLKSKGVPFQQFELPGATWEGDIAVMGQMKGAWFTDPDGNIFALDNGADM